MMGRHFTLKYNGHTLHVDGAAVRTKGSEFDYAESACSALSRSVRFFERAAKADTAAEVLGEASLLASALRKRFCKNCLEALKAEAAADAEAPAAEVPAAPAATGRALRPSQGESAVGSGWELLYDKPRAGVQIVRRQGVYALVCVKHLTVERLERLSDEGKVRKAGGWCPDCQH